MPTRNEPVNSPTAIQLDWKNRPERNFGFQSLRSGKVVSGKRKVYAISRGELRGLASLAQPIIIGTRHNHGLLQLSAIQALQTTSNMGATTLSKTTVDII